MVNKIMKSIRFDQYALSKAKQICNDYNITLTEAVEISLEYASCMLSLITVSDSMDPEFKDTLIKCNEDTVKRFYRLKGDYETNKSLFNKGYMDMKDHIDMMKDM